MAVKRPLTRNVFYQTIHNMAVKKVTKRVKKEVVPEMIVPVVPQKSLMEKAAPVMMAVIVIMAFGLGMMWTKLQGGGGKAQSFDARLASLAKETGLNAGKFKKCMQIGKKSVVDADAAQGAQAGVNGTPAFFINGRLIPGAVPFDEFKKILDEEINGGQNKPTEQRINVEVGSAPTRGKQGSLITMIEFSDFQCPYCSRVLPTVNQVLNEYGDKMLFAYKHFPLTQIHPLAQKAAEASECARDQGKFWEFHDKLFATQAEWSVLQ